MEAAPSICLVSSSRRQRDNGDEERIGVFRLKERADLIKERDSTNLETLESFPVLTRVVYRRYASRLSHKGMKIRVVSDLKSAFFFFC